MQDEYELTGARRSVGAQRCAGSALVVQVWRRCDMVAMCLVVSVLAAAACKFPTSRSFSGSQNRACSVGIKLGYPAVPELA